MWFGRLTTISFQNIDNFESFKTWDRGKSNEGGRESILEELLLINVF